MTHKLVGGSSQRVGERYKTQCECGWDSGELHSSLVASLMFEDHRAQVETGGKPPEHIHIIVDLDGTLHGHVGKAQGVEYVLPPQSVPDAPGFIVRFNREYYFSGIRFDAGHYEIRRCDPPQDEEIAQAIYEADPYYESGEYVNGFQVSPGGNLSWAQAKARDAEFAGDKLFTPITEFAYKAARAVASRPAHQSDELRDELDIRAIALQAMRDMHKAGESYEMCARWISERVNADLARDGKEGTP